ncbi:MAG: arsenate reductase (glutaredoxin) [Proteobacteria bacterium]|nr:arsenate reductase (glutaredoxin) [Pseudomonadota bacterium]
MANTELTIYHNPRCSKSRNALTILQEQGVQPLVIEYLKNPPDAAQISSLCLKLGIKPEQLIRKGESIFKEHYSGENMSDAASIQAMVKHPILIERPIIVCGKKAVIGRPPENVLLILNN